MKTRSKWRYLIYYFNIYLQFIEIEYFRASELAKYEELRYAISNINIEDYVQRFMSTHGYLKEILENSYYGIEEIKENTNEKTIKYIIEKVLYASRKLMVEFEDADVLAANKVFKEKDVVFALKRVFLRF